jgi:peptide deformylase
VSVHTCGRENKKIKPIQMMAGDSEETGAISYDDLPITTDHQQQSSSTLFGPISSLTEEISQKKHELFDSKEENLLDQDHTINISYNKGSNVPGRKLIECLLKPILYAIWLLNKLHIAFSTGHLYTLKRQVKIWLVIIAICAAMYWRAQATIQTMRATEEEKSSCHVCLDTSVVAEPPCKQATISDFTVHSKKLNALSTLMNNHVKHDKHICIASFHVGSKACAVSVMGLFSTSMYLNPVELDATWEQNPTKYKETSDFFSGVSLIRKRPSRITIQYTTLDTTTHNITLKTEQFTNDHAACVAHALEVLNGTHHEIYKKYKDNPPLTPV